MQEITLSTTGIVTGRGAVSAGLNAGLILFTWKVLQSSAINISLIYISSYGTKISR